MGGGGYAHGDPSLPGIDTGTGDNDPNSGGDARPECDRSIGNNAQKLDWINAHLTDATKVAGELGVTAADILGLSALESGWGNGRFAKQGNNFSSEHYPASLATGYITARGNTKVKVATFASYGDSAESFRLDYGSLVQNLADSAKFAAALQNAGKYGINPDGSKVSNFVTDTAGTISGLAKGLTAPDR